MSRLLTIWLLLFSLSSFLRGQETNSLNGQVISESEQAIAGVEVFHHESAQVVITDEEGLFEFKIAELATQSFTLFKEGYETKSLTVSFPETKDLVIQLKELSLDLNAIDIIAQREEFFAIKRLNDVEGTSIYSGKKTEVVIIDKVKANLAINKSRQVYAQVTGLNIYEGSEGGLQLNIGGRGLDPNRTSNFNTRQNGYDISADVLGYPESYYTPPAEAISQINIIRGAGSLQYGSQFGGLLDFKLRSLPSFRKSELISSQTIGAFGLINNFNYFGLNKGKFSVSTFYNYKRGNGFRAHSDYSAHYGFVSLGYTLNEQTSFSLEYTHHQSLAEQSGGLTDEQFHASPLLSTRDRNWFAVNWNLARLRMVHNFNSTARISFQLFGLFALRNSLGYRGNPILINENPITSVDEQDADGNYLLPRDLIKGKFKNHGVELKYLRRYRLGFRKAVLLTGFKYYKSANTAQQGPGSLGTDADFSFKTIQFSDYANQSDFNFPNRNIAFFFRKYTLSL